MSTLVARRLRGESGASLVIAMAFLTLFGVFIAALLGFAATSFKATVAVHDQGMAVYAAEGAVDTALTRIRNQPTMQLGQSGDTGCGLTFPALDGAPPASVTCTPQTPAGAVRPGIDGPANAILTMNGNLAVTGGGLLRTTGSVFANGGVDLGGATLDASDWAANATGACTPDPATNPTRWLAVQTQCNAADPTGDGAYPGYPSRIGELLVNGGIPKAKRNPKPTCVGRIVTFLPGYYDKSDHFEKDWSKDKKIKKACTPTNSAPLKEVVYLQPGVYYLNFTQKKKNPPPDTTDTKLIWNVKNNVRVVGGPPKGNWYSAGTAPPVPAAGATEPAACQPGPGAGGGVQVILGSASRIQLDTATSSLELCAPSDGPPANRIALYGWGPDDVETAPETITLRPSAFANVTGFLAYNARENLLGQPDPDPEIPVDPDTPVIDGFSASVTIPKNGRAAVTLSGFDWVDEDFPDGQVDIPKGFTIASAVLRIRHQENPASSVRPVPGGIRVRVDSNMGAGDDCDVITPPATDTFASPPDYETYSCPKMVGKKTKNDAKGDFASSLVITYEVNVDNLATTQPVTSLLDGIEFDLTFRPVLFAQSGCITAGTCSMLVFPPSATATAAIWGTVYAPGGHLAVNFNGARNTVFDRGVVVKSLNVANLPATDATGRFRLANGSGRTVELVGFADGNRRVRAVVRIVDAATRPGWIAQVRKWSVTR